MRRLTHDGAKTRESDRVALENVLQLPANVGVVGGGGRMELSVRPDDLEILRPIAAMSPVGGERDLRAGTRGRVVEIAHMLRNGVVDPRRRQRHRAVVANLQCIYHLIARHYPVGGSEFDGLALA